MKIDRGENSFSETGGLKRLRALACAPSIPRRLPVWLCSCLAALLAAGALLAAEAPRPFDVPAGDAAETLKLAASQGGIEIVFFAETVRGVRTAELRGKFPPHEALERLVAHTGLTLSLNDSVGTVTVLKNPVPPLNPPPANPTVKSTRTFVSVLTSWFAATATTLAQSPVVPTKDDPIELSPFVVSSDSQRGYLATQTLNGTRLKTDLKDIGSSLTVFTEEMMNDIGANSIYGLMAFAPNTDPFVMTTSDVTGNGNDFINIPTKFVTRGGASTVIAQDFFSSPVPQDRFNTESLTFTRGPNAILFGLGNAAGAFLSSTKRAKPKDALSFEEQIDSRGGHRATLDINRVLIKNYLSFRYAGLLEGLNSFRINDNTYQRRHFFTLNFTPFKRTTLRVNYDQGHLQQSAVRPWPDYDAVSPWLAAGSPILSTFTNSAAGKPAGTQNFPFAGLISTEFTPGGTPIPTQTLQNQGQSAPTTFANGFPVNGANFRSFINPSIYPTFASSFSNTAYRPIDYHTFTAFWEQQITRDLFVELAFNRTSYQQNSLNGFVGQMSYLYVDPNAQLPNGQPNPNVGKLYSESQPTQLHNAQNPTNVRATTSYEFDFARHTSGRLGFLGRHAAAVFIQQDNSPFSAANNSLVNATPLAKTGPTAALTNAANVIRYRYYYDPANGKVSPSAGRRLEALPDLFANDPITPNASGITPAFMNVSGPNGSYSIVKTRALAAQSFFWKDRIVLTNGLRQDDQTSWNALAADFAGLRDANGVYPSAKGVKLSEFVPRTRTERGGHTYSRGLVFHALPWVSLSYNTSTNFSVNAGVKNIFGDVLPNPQGKGSDYGMRFSLFESRLFFDLTYYTNENVNAAENITVNTAGDFSQFNDIWAAVASFTGDAKYLSPPHSNLSFVKQDIVSTTSKGWEFTLTGNPSKHWRVTVNGSVRGDNTTSPRGYYTNLYLAQYIPLVKSHPEWQNLNANGVTVAAAVASLQNTLTNFNAVRSSPSANFASNWTLNLIQTYELPREAKILGVPLGGISIGGSMNARGKAVDGFAVNSALVLDPTAPYYAPGYTNFGAWVTYKRKLFKNRIDWRLQMNVRNLFDDNTVSPLITVDSRDGKHTPNVAIYQLKEPRTYQFTSTFKY